MKKLLLHIMQASLSAAVKKNDIFMSLFLPCIRSTSTKTVVDHLQDISTHSPLLNLTGTQP